MHYLYDIMYVHYLYACTMHITGHIRGRNFLQISSFASHPCMKLLSTTFLDRKLPPMFECKQFVKVLFLKACSFEGKFTRPHVRTAHMRSAWPESLKLALFDHICVFLSIRVAPSVREQGQISWVIFHDSCVGKYKLKLFSSKHNNMQILRFLPQHFFKAMSYT